MELNSRRRVTGLFLGLLAACHSHPATPPEMLVLTGIKGTVAPCGCTSRPLGGVAKIARLVADDRAQDREPVLVTAGDFLFDTEARGAPQKAQAEARARLLSAVFADVGVSAQLPGPADRAYASEYPGAWLTAPKTLVSKGLRIGVLPLGAAPPASADVIVALTDLGWEEAKRRPSDADIVIVAGEDQVRSQRVGKSWLIEVGDRGQHLGRIEFHQSPGTGQGWQFYDAGEGDQALLSRQLASLDKQLASLPQGHPGRAARETQEQSIKQQLETLTRSPPPPPTGRYFAFSVVTFEPSMPDAQKVIERVGAYNQTLCELTKTSMATVTCDKAGPRASSYVGSQACKNCHALEYDQWQSTQHAHALATLDGAGQRCDLGCIGCHTVGFNQPGGFCKPLELGNFANVGCEMCHGAGSVHAQSGDKTAVVRDPSVSVCRQCHTPEHSDRFDFASYRPRIVHQR